MPPVQESEGSGEVEDQEFDENVWMPVNMLMTILMLVN